MPGKIIVGMEAKNTPFLLGYGDWWTRALLRSGNGGRSSYFKSRTECSTNVEARDNIQHTQCHDQRK